MSSALLTSSAQTSLESLTSKHHRPQNQLPSPTLTSPSFILNGLVHANILYDEEIFHIPDWRVIGEYVYDEDGGRHQAFVSPTRDVEVLGHLIRANERSEE